MNRLLPALVLLVPLAGRAGGFEEELAAMEEKSRARVATVRAELARGGAPAKPAPKPAAMPAAADADWAKIVEAVKTKGKYQPGVFIIPAMFILEDVEGDPKGDHVTRLVTFSGMVNRAGKFEAQSATVVWMEFKRDAATGNFNAEQWGFETDIYGRVNGMGRMTAVLGPDEQPVAPPSTQLLQAGDAAAEAKFEALVKFWAGK